MNAIVLPSGDHSKPPTPVSDLVSWTASPPSGRMAKIWDLSSTRLEVKAIQRPSGDQVGSDEDFLPRVSWIDPPDATSSEPDLRDVGVLLEIGLGDRVGDAGPVGRDARTAQGLQGHEVLDGGHAARVRGLDLGQDRECGREGHDGERQAGCFLHGISLG